MTDLARRPKTRGIDNRQAIYTSAGSLVHAKVPVNGSGGVSATVVITVQQGHVWMSIQPPFTWEAIMEPGKIEELIQTLVLAAESAKKMAHPVQP